MPGCKPLLNLARPFAAAACTFLLTAAFAHPAAAQMSSAECGTENLIAGKMPVGQQDAHGDARLVTDGKVATEGAQWDTTSVVEFLDTPAGTLTYDLGVVRSVSAFLLQADANSKAAVPRAIAEPSGLTCFPSTVGEAH